MRFTLISDVHIDKNPWDWCLLQHCDPTIPMVVSGDISNDVRKSCAWIAELATRFPLTAWVAGNHCMYNLGFFQTRLYDAKFESTWPYPRNVPEIYAHYKAWSAAHGVHFLDGDAVTLSGIQFVGATGWHNFDAAPYLSFDAQVEAWQMGMPDAPYIRWHEGYEVNFKPVLQKALEDALKLRELVRSNPDPKVVITHHVPHRNLMRFSSNNPSFNLLNGSFLNTELETVVDPSVKAWCYGHTHWRDDRMIGLVRYVNNARGYRGENDSWKPVEIEVG